MWRPATKRSLPRWMRWRAKVNRRQFFDQAAAEWYALGVMKEGARNDM